MESEKEIFQNYEVDVVDACGIASGIQPLISIIERSDYECTQWIESRPEVPCKKLVGKIICKGPVLGKCGAIVLPPCVEENLS